MGKEQYLTRNKSNCIWYSTFCILGIIMGLNFENITGLLAYS